MIQRLFYSYIVIVNISLVIITIIIAGLLLIFGIAPLFTKGYNLSLTINGVVGFQNFWTECIPLIKAFIAFLTLSIASIQLKRHIDLATTTTLAKLREMLTMEMNMEIHHRIQNDYQLLGVSSNGEKNIFIRNVDVYNYLGTLELGAIMVRRKTIKIDEFAKQFGYRVEAAMNNNTVKTDFVFKEPEYYDDLIAIWNELNEYYRKKRKS